MNKNFFDSPTEGSKIKIEIVRQYFWSWSKIIATRTQGNIAFIDLFSGKGIYSDGTKSIPVLIIESALREPVIKKKLITVFNDIDSSQTHSLQTAISNIPNISELVHKPNILNEKIGDDFGQVFQKMNLVPTLLFADPWGYEGITLELLKSVLKDWGCECIFFFNYNRVNMCFNNPILNPKVNVLFGESRAEQMKSNVNHMNPSEREDYIINNLKEALKEIGGKYFLSFKFKDAKYGTKTEHFLIFTTKHPLAYTIMKDIMAKQSSYDVEGVPSYIYSPKTPDELFSLFPPKPLIELENHLLKEYAGKTVGFKQLFEEDHLGKDYIKKNYRVVLLKLELEAKVRMNPPHNERRKNTLGESVRITFP